MSVMSHLFAQDKILEQVASKSPSTSSTSPETDGDASSGGLMSAASLCPELLPCSDPAFAARQSESQAEWCRQPRTTTRTTSRSRGWDRSIINRNQNRVWQQHLELLHRLEGHPLGLLPPP